MNVPKIHKRSWGDLFEAFGRAHHKASSQLETSMPLFRHLEELRRRVFIAFGAVIITTVISLVFTDNLIAFFAVPLGGKDALVSIEITENMAIYMRVALLSGVILAMPVVFYQMIAFIMPGLKSRERLWLLAGVPMASILFIVGVIFTWFVLIPAAIPFLINFLGIKTQVRPANYFTFITQLMFWIGIFFEMPLVTFLLAKMRMVTARQLTNGWRYALVGIAMVAGGITPTIDPVNMALVMLPLILLYGLSIFSALIAGRYAS
ncbi:MAG: twin-arginine translocase subunit TatC [Anaerolineales bacterium]|nr:twin-arginine translocase subunit TatC [Anaerolineales bacterium]